MKKLLAVLLLLSTSAFATGTGRAKHVFREIDPTLTTSQYLIGTQLDAPKRVLGAVNSSGDYSRIHNLTVIDRSGKASPLRVWMFANKPVMSSLNGQAFSITGAASSTANLLGVINVTSASYIKQGNGERAVAELPLLDHVIQAGPATQDIWAVVEAASTITYNAANDLILKFGIEQD